MINTLRQRGTRNMREFNCMPANQSARSRRMLEGYLLNLRLGAGQVREMIQADITRFSELGAWDYAADLMQVLSSFDSREKLAETSSERGLCRCH